MHEYIVRLLAVRGPSRFLSVPVLSGPSLCFDAVHGQLKELMDRLDLGGHYEPVAIFNTSTLSFCE
jgi:hypothetical protein